MKLFVKAILLTAMFLPYALYADNAAGLTAIQAGNYPLALQEFQEAANQGDAAAESNLGLMYARGLGVEENGTKALALYQQSAKKGYADAMINMGSLYTTGNKDVKKNAQLGIYWYEQAMKAGKKGEGAYNIGLIYCFGRGVEKNYTAAAKYFNIGAKNGYLLSMEMLGYLYLNGQGLSTNYQQAYNYFYKAKMLGDKDAEQGLAQLYAKLTPQQIQQLQAGTFKMSEITSS